MGKSGKGSSFEREICKRLSLWWSNGADDDIFWRTSGSGARATTRSKQRKATFGQNGDVQATNPIGQPLIDLCSIELKRGYSGHTIADMLDCADGTKPQQYELFIQQAIKGSHNAKSKTWMLIVKRDRKKELVIVPFSFLRRLRSLGCLFGCCPISAFVSFIDKEGKSHSLYVTHLDRFLDIVQPSHIRKTLKEWDEKNELA